jgi:hypothetical protein
MKIFNRMERFFRLGILIALISVFVFEPGCATQSATTKSETITTYPESDIVGTEQLTGQSVVVEKKTTTTTETKDEPQGVLSTTVNIVGEAIALPFRIVGGLIRAIF